MVAWLLPHESFDMRARAWSGRIWRRSIRTSRTRENHINVNCPLSLRNDSFPFGGHCSLLNYSAAKSKIIWKCVANCQSFYLFFSFIECDFSSLSCRFNLSRSRTFCIFKANISLLRTTAKNKYYDLFQYLSGELYKKKMIPQQSQICAII